MADNSAILLSNNDKDDETQVGLDVLEIILGIATRKVDGVSEMRGALRTSINTLFGRSSQGEGVSLSVEDDKLTADVYAYLDCGVNVSKICVELQKSLTLQLKQVTDLDLTQIDARVVGLVSETEETGSKVEADTEALFPGDKENEARDWMMQYEMRRIAMQAIYLTNRGNLTSAEEVCQKALKALKLKSFPDYSTEMINDVLTSKKAPDEQLGKYLKKGWRLNRINEIDLAILEATLYEMQNSEVIEPVAALNEALNLCDEFSSRESKKFINGLLANFIKKD